MNPNNRFAPSFRGVASARADATAQMAKINEIAQAFEAFKEANNKAMEDLKKGQADVVQAEKVDRINASLDTMGKELDALNQKVAAGQIGGSSAESEEVKVHKAAFDDFFRTGTTQNLRTLEAKAQMSTDSDPKGGFLVPTHAETEIDRVLGGVSAMRGLARVVQIAAGSYSKPVNLGGASSGWVGEKQSRAATGTPNLAAIEIEAMELYAEPAATQTLLDDAQLDIAAWLAQEVSIEFAEQEGEAFIKGSGVKMPRGILSYDTVANASHAWGKIGFVASGKADGFVAPTASASPADALIDLLYSAKSGYRSNGSWLMSDATMGTVRKFKNSDGDYIWAPPSGASEVATILQKPVYTDDNMDTVGVGAYPIAFGDFRRGYTIVDRRGIRVLRDELTSKPFVKFYTTKRVGGGVVDFNAIKLLKIAA